MLRRTVILLLLLGIVSACQSGGGHPAGRAAASKDAQLRNLLAGVDLFPRHGAAPGTGELEVSLFAYKGAERTPYGSGFGIFDRASDQLLWIHLIPGDYPPHTLQWEDFDGDGRPDLFFLAGGEDVFATHIVFNRVATKQFALTNFYPGVIIDDAYAFVVENAENPLPDVLLPLDPRPNAADFEVRCLDSDFGDELRRRVVAEVERIAGRFGRFAYSLEFPDIFLFEPVRFVNFKDGWWTDVTQRHRGHLYWRLTTLQESRGRVDRSCASELDALISHLTESLGSLEER